MIWYLSDCIIFFTVFLLLSLTMADNEVPTNSTELLSQSDGNTTESSTATGTHQTFNIAPPGYAPLFYNHIHYTCELGDELLLFISVRQEHAVASGQWQWQLAVN